MPATFLLHSAFICTKPAKFCSHRRPSAELPRLVGTACHPATAQLGWEDAIHFFMTACCQLCRRAPQLPTHRRLLHPRPHNPGLTIRPTTPPAPPYYPPPDRASQPRHGLGQCRPGGLLCGSRCGRTVTCSGTRMAGFHFSCGVRVAPKVLYLMWVIGHC